jgi:hypothetical protein
MLARLAGVALMALAAIGARADAGPASHGVVGWLGAPQSLHVPAAAPNVYSRDLHLVRDRPHPAVARIIVPEGDTATSYGSGTLVDVRDRFGLVVTNWHVVRDGVGEVEVVFPGGFRSKARPLKVDADWDLAALVIWRPPVKPVPLATRAPQPGDQLTICGYGSGQYRAATGQCTQYYAPSLDLPQHMVELDVEARQGDSGGPIFNDRGELAGVLFGAGRGTTLGSFGGRVESFLATLAPDIGRASSTAIAQPNEAPPAVEPDAPAQLAEAARSDRAAVSISTPPIVQQAVAQSPKAAEVAIESNPPAGPEPTKPRNDGWQPVAAKQPAIEHPPSAAAPPELAFLHGRNILAVVGVIAIASALLRAVR